MALLGQHPGGQEQAVTWQEKADQQATLGKDGGEEAQIRGAQQEVRELVRG